MTHFQDRPPPGDLFQVPRRRQARVWRTLLTYAALIAALIAVSALPFILFDGDFGRIAEQVITRETPYAAVVAIGIVLLVADLFLVIPSGLIIALMAGLIGSVSAAITGAAGLSLACALGYWIGKSVGDDFSDDADEKREFGYVTGLLRRYGLVMLAAFRPIPLLGEVSVIAAGALGLPAKAVLATTTLANAGVASLYAAIGTLSGSGWTGLALVVAASLALPGFMTGLIQLLRVRHKTAETSKKIDI